MGEVESEKAPDTGAASPQRQAWQGRMCPELTKAAITGREIAKAIAPKSVLTLPGQPEPMAQPPEMEALGCQGPGCMWFVPEINEQGRLQGGNCATFLNPIAGNMVGMTLQTLLHDYELRRKK